MSASVHSKGKESNMYTVTEASERLGISDAHCRRLLRSGEIEGKRLARDWIVFSLDYKRKRKPKTKKGESNDKS